MLLQSEKIEGEVSRDVRVIFAKLYLKQRMIPFLKICEVYIQVKEEEKNMAMFMYGAWLLAR